jgi:hypothetical protein
VGSSGSRARLTSSPSLRPLSAVKDLRFLAFNVENLFVSTGRFERTSATELRPVAGRGPEPKSEREIQQLRDVINDINPDIAVITEVESLGALQAMAARLESRFKGYVIEGNDSRGIDIGFLVKADLPFHVTHETHKDMKWFDPIDRREIPLFSRDVPALLLRRTQGDKPFLIVLGNHAKSKRDRPGDPESNILRTAQYEGIATIIRSYQRQYGIDVPILLAGDFNTDVRRGPELSPLRGLLASAFDHAPVVTPVSERITHTYHPKDGPTDAKQMDDFQASAALLPRLEEALVYRYRNADGSIMPFARTFAERQRQPSDHLPVVLRISTDGLW